MRELLTFMTLVSFVGCGRVSGEADYSGVFNHSGGRWIDLDGSLSPTQFDATHITLATSSLEDGRYFNDLASMVPLLGRLSIRVIDLCEADGRGIGAE